MRDNKIVTIVDGRSRHKERHLANLDVNGRWQAPMDMCPFCGQSLTYEHPYNRAMCVDCGKLYDRFRKARARVHIHNDMSQVSELRLTRQRLLARWVDKDAKLYKQVEQTEVPEMNETEKVCKQCGRLLPIENFKKYAARGRGVYATKQGHYTICKQCESISNRAAAALSKGDEATISLLTEHYQMLADRGLPPVTAAAKRLLGYTDISRPKSDRLSDLLASVRGDSVTMRAAAARPVESESESESESELDKHCRLVRCRGYASVEEAEIVHKELIGQLRDAGLYEEINDLLDEWYMEG